MVYYIRHGEMPESRHTYTGRDKLLREELFGLKAFDGEYSLLYHYMTLQRQNPFQGRIKKNS